MSKSFWALGLTVSALALTCLPAAAQTKVTNEGISPTEIVIGDKRPYLTCLVMIDHENVEKFAQDHDIPFTNYASLCRAPEIQDLIQREIEAVNANVARVEAIKKFFLIERQLTPEDEELTPTMKLKRNFVNKRYAAEIDAMYRDRAAA